ncbi:MAG TPA: hypothetical protein VN193_02790 [Candidatus Angelobacter sp.]|jgi:hypothetical protein|nr:hypothetical protein [Candidatus Angelobacter sp.]
MRPRIVPLIPLADAIETVLNRASDFVDSVQRRDLHDTNHAYLALEAAVDAQSLARDAHAASIGVGTPYLAIIRGGLGS